MNAVRQQFHAAHVERRLRFHPIPPRVAHVPTIAAVPPRIVPVVIIAPPAPKPPLPSPPPRLLDHNAHVVAFEKAVLAQMGQISPFSVGLIIECSARYFDVSVEEVMSIKRGHFRLRARHIAMWIARKHCRRSFPAIGKLFGGRNHSTVFYAIRKMELLAGANEAYAADVSAILTQAKLMTIRQMRQEAHLQ